MTVRQLLNSLTSFELAEWEAYENATGPLGFDYIHESLAEILDEVRASNVMAAQKWEDPPYKMPDRAQVRPHQMRDYAKAIIERNEEIEENGPPVDPDEVSQEQFDALFDENGQHQ